MLPDIAAAKRLGLPVDLPRLTREGDAWLTPEDRYALKTRGVCAQLQEGVFMIRVRVPGGVLPTAQARGVARLAKRLAGDWLHLTTRQNVELHWVDAHDVEEVLVELQRIGLSSRSACGHTLRNVMCSEDAGVGFDEPFDCLPDARRVSDAIVARSESLNCILPSRVNMAFGGSVRCRQDALVNDAGFVSMVRDGHPGYELWAGGSLGKAPALAVPLSDFVGREDVVAAAEALVDVFVAHGDLDTPAKGRMKFVIEAMGEAAFRRAWDEAYAEARNRPRLPPVPVEVLGAAARSEVLGRVPAGGWSAGIRPQRVPGMASLTIGIPLGDTCASEVELFCDLADRHGDGHLTVSRDQDIVLRNVGIAAVPGIRSALDERGLGFLSETAGANVRACTGSAVCALGITTAPDGGKAVLDQPGIVRNSVLKVHVSGCPNSCAQHQIADIGLSGSKVRVAGRTVDGYQVHVGADLDQHLLGEVVGRVGEADLPAAVDAIVGVWEAMRHPGETLGRTVRRVGLDAVTAHVGAVLAERWAEGPELADADLQPVPIP